MANRILIVEDDANLREVYGIYLRASGYEILEAGSGRAAIDILRDRREEIGLILTDGHMEEGDGAWLADHRPDPACPIVLITADLGYLATRGPRFNEALAKPFDHSRLEKVLETHLRPRDA